MTWELEMRDEDRGWWKYGLWLERIMGSGYKQLVSHRIDNKLVN